MTNEQVDTLVGRLEQQARRNPAAYRFKVLLALLGNALNALTEKFDRRWQNHVLPAWQERHREVQQDRRRLTELNARYDNGAELTLQEAYDRARLTGAAARDADAALGPFRLHSKKRAVEVLQRIQETVRFPGETSIVNVDGDHYRFGRKFGRMRGARIL